VRPAIEYPDTEALQPAQQNPGLVRHIRTNPINGTCNLRDTLLVTFWNEFPAKQRTLAHRLCLLLWTASGKQYLPREFQLHATLALLSGKDVLVDVGTGYGKTICMVLPCILDPTVLSMIISPLKRLQALQVLEFQRYGVKTISVNEDTRPMTLSSGRFDALPTSHLVTGISFLGNLGNFCRKIYCSCGSTRTAFVN